ncbi:MAG: hypothetical protein PVH60_02750, partial [Anaerolineales bacterium]
MFRNLRVSREKPKVPVEPGGISARELTRDASLPIAIRQINELPENAKRRVFRSVLPTTVLTRFKISPVTWRSPNGGPTVSLRAEGGSGVVNLSIATQSAVRDPYFSLELQDNVFQGIDLNLLILGDPEGEYFQTDFDQDGNATLFGTVRRNREQELKALQAGLSPGQTRIGLGASKPVLSHLETFLSTLGQEAYFLEPLTYTSAW